MRPVNGQVLLVASGKCKGMKSDKNKGTSGSEECWKRCGLAQPVSSGNVGLLQLHVRITFLRQPVSSSTEKCLYIFSAYIRSETIWETFKDSVWLLVPVWKIQIFFFPETKKSFSKL